MLEPITKQELIDASADAQTLEDVVNGTDVTDVTSRLARTYPTLAKALRLIVENGLLGATPFNLKSAMEASTLVNDDYAVVTDDPTIANNGFYQKQGGVWDFLAWNPVNQAKAYADANPMFRPSVLAASVDLNTATTAGFYLLSATPTNSVAQNYPANLNGFLHVYHSTSSGSTQLAQIFIGANGKCFVRYRAGSTFTAWYNDYDAVLTYLQTAVQTVNTVNIAYGTNLNTLQTSGFYVQNVSASATTASNYPVGSAGAGFLSVIRFNSGLIYQTYQVRDSARVFRRVFNGTWGAWVDAGPADLSVTKPKLATALTDQMKKRLEFFPVGAANGVTYNSTTRVLSWPHLLLAASAEYAATLRLRIPAGSVTFAGTGYEVLYIDLSLVPADGSLTDLTPLKIASYASNGFLDKFDQVPLAKLDISGKIYSCAGFLPIADGSSAAGGSKDTFKFVKTAASSFFYLPTSSGKLSRVRFYRQLVAFNTSLANSQSDVWRLADVFECDPNTLAEQRYIIVDGEWDTAIRVTGAADHSGGVHGDELQTSSYFLIDGCHYAQDAVITADVREIIFVQQSRIYFENTTTVLAERTKVMTVTKDGIKNYQKIVFKAAANLFTAWVTMLPIKRKANDDNTGDQITDKAVRFPSYGVEDVSSTSFTAAYTAIADGDYAVVSSTASGISAKVKVSGFVGMPNPDLHISNSGFFNKLYVSAINAVTQSYNVSVNETWEIEGEYELNIK